MKSYDHIEDLLSDKSFKNWVVVPDSLLPFRAFSGELETIAMGTSFNINSYEKGEVRVQLVTGKVKVIYGSRKISLISYTWRPFQEKRISGEFTDTYLSDVFESLGYAYGFAYQIKNKEVVINFTQTDDI